MSFQEYLQTSAQEINQEMGVFFTDWSKEVENVSPKLIHLSKAFIEASEGGKRLRGALVRLGYQLAGGEDTQDILKAAVAFEIFQTAILAHDDIIDQSPLRRSKPTLYHSLGGDHYGVSQTISLGDIGFFLAVRLISQSNVAQERKYQAINLFVQAMLETAMGQMLDVELPYRKESKDEIDALTVFRLKTAKYTLVGPLHLGAILGGGGAALLDNLNVLGESLGIAFQIQDDILGVFGEEKVVGKSVTSDIEEGKNTLLLIQALKKATAEQVEILNKFYGHGKIGLSELEKIRQVFINTGALDYSQTKASLLVDEAKKVIKGMDVKDEQRQLLLEMAEFLVKRDK